MPTFLLVRHGENDYMKLGRLACRLPGIHLNDAGRLQAQATAEMIAHFISQAAAQLTDQEKAHKQADVPVRVVVYSSPMERAMETAAPIAQTLDLEVIVRDGLIETNCADWAGKTVKSLQRRKDWKVILNTPSQFRFPGGESFKECQQRMVDEIESLRTHHGPRDLVICVSHADPIKLAVAYYLGLPLDHFQRLSVGPASITVLHLAKSGGQLQALNVNPSFFLAKG